MTCINHRRLARRMELYTFDVGRSAAAHWLPLGWELYRRIEDHVRRKLGTLEFEEVKTPRVPTRQVYLCSGDTGLGVHGTETFQTDRCHRFEGLSCCGGHLQLFGAITRSWRDLPIRYMEILGPSGDEQRDSSVPNRYAGTGKRFDGHIFCGSGSVASETRNAIRLLQEIYFELGFQEIEMRLHVGFLDRMHVGPQLQAAETDFVGVAMSDGIRAIKRSDDSFFGGPALEICIRDGKGRAHSVAWLHLDTLIAPLERKAYVAMDGGREAPVVLHLTALTSLERLIQILLEYHQGHLPLWCAPLQLAVLPVSKTHGRVAEDVMAILKASSVRAKLFAQRETLARRIVRVRDRIVPACIVIGDREVETGVVFVQNGKDSCKVEFSNLGAHVVGLCRS